MESIVIDGNEYQCTLHDDGTLDTVIEVHDVTTGKSVTWRYSDTSEYRDCEGELDFDRFCEDTVGPDAATYDWDDVRAPSPDRDKNAFYDAETQGGDDYDDDDPDIDPTDIQNILRII